MYMYDGADLHRGCEGILKDAGKENKNVMSLQFIFAMPLCFDNQPIKIISYCEEREDSIERFNREEAIWRPLYSVLT